MPVKRQQQSGAKKKKRDENVARASLSGRLHSVKTCETFLAVDVIANFTTTNASNILSEFPCSLTKISHAFNTNKTKNHGSCRHGNRKLTMVLLLQIIIYKEVDNIFCAYKNRHKPTTAFKMT